ncbi:MAG: hypothetical protein PHG23_02295 [Candidatus Pacebacteria bacterium]|nr:hypothetical protein [Candidatus Paceibacterota bacterium]
MEKIISFNTRLFIEDITTKYGLENFLLQNDAGFASHIVGNPTAAERIAAKLMFNKDVKNCLEKNIPLAEILPSEKLVVVVEDLINQKIGYNDLPIAIKEELNIPDEISSQIAQDIANNKKITEDRINEIVKEDFEEETQGSEFSNTPSPEKTGGLSQELQ